MMMMTEKRRDHVGELIQSPSKTLRQCISIKDRDISTLCSQKPNQPM
jgi:hypothetical protein